LKNGFEKYCLGIFRGWKFDIVYLTMFKSYTSVYICLEIYIHMYNGMCIYLLWVVGTKVLRYGLKFHQIYKNVPRRLDRRWTSVRFFYHCGGNNFSDILDWFGIEFQTIWDWGLASTWQPYFQPKLLLAQMKFCCVKWANPGWAQVKKFLLKRWFEAWFKYHVKWTLVEPGFNWFNTHAL